MKKLFAILTFFAALASTYISATAQDLSIPPPSPTEKFSQQFGTSKIEIAYSRPGVKGRVIYGGLVPYGEVWRTGANTSTKIRFGDAVKLEGQNVPAGYYALYTIPDKDKWTIIISKDTTLWGAYGYKQENDLVRFTVKPMSMPMMLEDFTIDINNIKPTECDIILLWEKTAVSFHVTTEIDTKIMAQIDAAMKTDKPPYMAASRYYLENGKDINKAYEWVKKADAAHPDDYDILTVKAKIELKMGKNSDATATATRAIELAKKDNDTGVISQNQKIIDDAKMKK